MKREIRARERLIDRCVRAGELILQTVISTGVKMAGGAGGASVAAGLHIPEQRLAERDQRLLVSHVALDADGRRRRHGFQ